MHIKVSKSCLTFVYFDYCNLAPKCYNIIVPRENKKKKEVDTMMTITEKTINFDMDGTIASLYDVEGWLEMLRAFDPTPYEVAKPLVNLSLLARTIHQLQNAGYKVAIISWLSKCSTEDYDRAVTQAKLKWLAKHLPSVVWDEISIVPYGTPKSECGCGILFDDEERNRNEWNGIAFDEKDLIANLKMILKGVAD